MKRRLRLLWLLVPVLVCALLLTLRPATPNLLSRAHKIADVKSWDRYFWIDSDRLLIFEKSQGRPAAHILDIRSGKTRALPSLNQALKQFSLTDIVNVSPNGEWLLVETPKRTKGWAFTLALCSIKDGTIKTYADAGLMFGWLSDSSGWIVLSSQNTYKLFKTSSQEPVLLPTKLNLKQPGVNLGATSAGTYVSADWSPYTTTDIKIKETDLSTGKLVNAFSIPSPGGDLLGPLMSPDGHRLLWHMGRGIHEGPLGWFHSFMMALRSGAETQTIWVSNLDGTSMRILGSVDVNSDTGFYAQFIPDGKSLSFTYNGWLWTAPID